MQKCPVCNGTGEAAYWVDPKNPDRIFDMDDFLDEELTQNLKKTTLQCLTCNGSGEVEQYERTVKEVPCPKDAALLELLDENEDQGRVVIFAGFTGSIDKITKLCLKEKWAVVRVDGRGWITLDPEGEQIQGNPLDYWADKDNQKVAFVAHPKSGGMGLTLTEARMAIYYSNSYESESRIQSEGRIHRIGMDLNRGATIVDLINLPTDEAVLQRLKDNRRLELMTMGEIEECFHS
jgi:SNF2 family DNA or RNA helicase